MHSLSYAALPNVTGTTMCGLGLDLVHKIGCHGNVTGRIAKLRSLIYIHSSTNTANLVKVGLVDVEIIGLTEVVKNNKETAAKPKPTSDCEAHPRWANRCLKTVSIRFGC